MKKQLLYSILASALLVSTSTYTMEGSGDSNESESTSKNLSASTQNDTTNADNSTTNSNPTQNTTQESTTKHANNIPDDLQKQLDAAQKIVEDTGKIVENLRKKYDNLAQHMQTKNSSDKPLTEEQTRAQADLQEKLNAILQDAEREYTAAQKALENMQQKVDQRGEINSEVLEKFINDRSDAIAKAHGYTQVCSKNADVLLSPKASPFNIAVLLHACKNQAVHLNHPGSVVPAFGLFWLFSHKLEELPFGSENFKKNLIKETFGGFYGIIANMLLSTDTMQSSYNPVSGRHNPRFLLTYVALGLACDYAYDTLMNKDATKSEVDDDIDEDEVSLFSLENASHVGKWFMKYAATHGINILSGHHLF